MKKRLLVVQRLDKEGNFSYYTSFYNEYSGLYNMTTLLMQLNGVDDVENEKEREKYSKEIYAGKNGLNVYFDFGTDVFCCRA